MPDHSADYVAQPDEQLWDHSNRIILTCVGRLFAATMGRSNVEVGEIPVWLAAVSHASAECGSRMGAYIAGQRDNVSALRTLLKAREELHERFVWTTGPGGQISGPLISIPGDARVRSALSDASFAFAQFVKTWQPLMDSMAGLVWVVFETTGHIRIKAPGGLTELAQVASRSNWPDPASRFKKVLIDHAAWYLNDLRVLRNRFVHNERVATLLPAIGSPRTTVEVKKLHVDTTSEKFELDEFLNWSYGHLLLFCSSFAMATDSMY